ncbi:hypothetical protein G6M12_19060 [Agrobacterium tumefaciens]|nr:hypothetical protein [Agrobacterium tumefaciens]
MLDIYYADFDTTVIHSDPGCLEFAGSIDVDAHRSLPALFDKARRADVDGRRRGYPVTSFACVAGASCLAGAVMGLLRADGPASLCGSSAPPVSDGILFEADKVPALADELEPVSGAANCQHLPIPGNTSFSDFVKSKIRRFQGFIGGAGRTSGPMTTRPAAARKRHPLVAL